MKLAPLTFAIVLLIVGPAALAGTLEPFKVTFRTTDCNGETGMVSVDVDRIEKIRALDCGPGYHGKQLRQVLTRPVSGSTSYEVSTVTPEDAEKIERQIQDYMQARKRAVEGSRPIIIEH
jgi:hypothetical protein